MGTTEIEIPLHYNKSYTNSDQLGRALLNINLRRKHMVTTTNTKNKIFRLCEEFKNRQFNNKKNTFSIEIIIKNE